MREAQAHRRPRKRFGQHFLEPVWAAKVVDAVAPAADDTLIEIGPGRGAITRALSARARQVLAFEIDRDLAAEMRAAAIPNLHVVEGDFLDIEPAQIRTELDALPSPIGALRVVGNLPYNVASPILFRLLELRAAGIALENATVMLQREVADRLLARPSTKEYGVLSVLIGHQADVTRRLQLPAGAFRPPPRVLSTVVRLDFHSPRPAVQSLRVFSSLTQAIFTRRRKTLANALLALPLAPNQVPIELLRTAGIDPVRRPETLSIDELGRLADVLAETEPSSLRGA